MRAFLARIGRATRIIAAHAIPRGAPVAMSPSGQAIRGRPVFGAAMPALRLLDDMQARALEDWRARWWRERGYR